jgi:hypothetical protein
MGRLEMEVEDLGSRAPDVEVEYLLSVLGALAL